MDINSIVLGAGLWVGGFVIGSFIMPFVKVKSYKYGINITKQIANYVEKIKDEDAKNATIKTMEDIKKDKIWREKLVVYLDTLKKIPGPVDDIIVESVKSAIDGFVEN